MAFQVGHIVGDYRIVAVVGSGAIRDVYKTEHVITRRLEAMKVLAAGRRSTEDADRFMREIQVQASLNHPNIAAVHTAFRSEEDLVLVMELVDGRTLESMLAEGRIPLQTAVSYMRQVLAALAYAHAHGVVHRDVSPSNIVITGDGAIKLTDFGLAKRQSDARMTQGGAFIGSPHYMAPEQARGDRDSDARADIYSAGAVLYHLVTGRTMFDSVALFDVLAAQIGKTPPPPREVDPSIPPALNDVILRALAKEPERRFRSAGEFRAALEAVKLPPPTAYPKPQPKTAPKQLKRAPALLLGATSATTVIVLCGAIWFLTQSATTPAAPAQTVPKQVVQHPSDAPRENKAAVPAMPAPAPTPETPNPASPPVENTEPAPATDQPVQHRPVSHVAHRRARLLAPRVFNAESDLLAAPLAQAAPQLPTPKPSIPVTAFDVAPPPSTLPPKPVVKDPAPPPPTKPASPAQAQESARKPGKLRRFFGKVLGGSEKAQTPAPSK